MNKIKEKITFMLKKPELVFVIPAIIFGVISAIVMPQLIANDENMHFIRSYQLTELEVEHSCTIPVDIKERGFDAMYSEAGPDYSFSNKKIDQDNKIDTDCGTATSYNPLMHLPQSIGMAIAKVVWPTTGAMILLGRLMNVLFYSIGMYFIIRNAKIGKWLLVVIGLFPEMIHMSSSLSGDAVNNVIVLGFITYMFNLYTQTKKINKKQTIILFVLVILLATTKVPNLILLALIPFLPKKIIPEIRINKIKLSSFASKVIIVFAVGLVALGVLFSWSTLYNSPVIGDAHTANNPVIEKPIRFVKIVYNTYINPDNIFGGVSYSDWLIRGSVGSFSSFKYHLPFSVISMLFTLFLIVGLINNKKEYKLIKKTLKSLSLVATGTLVLIVLAITYALYTAWSIQANGIGPDAQFAVGLQGRYFTAFFLLLLPLMIMIRKYINVNIKEGITTGLLIFIVSLFALSVYILQTFSYIQAAGLY